jgi:hypothetical protein
MPFFKTANIPILGVYQSSGKFTKLSNKNPNIDDVEVKKSINLISKDLLNGVSKVYNISNDINDYIFPVPRAVTASVPNSNGDNFSHEELTRFSTRHRCLVYNTFKSVGLHVEHAASDPKTARGFIPDVHYMQENPKDKHVLTVVAMDTTKDPALGEGLLSGEIDSFSMGCICDSVECSYCGKIANSDRDMCDHLRYYKLSKIDNKLVYENCLGVEYQELSVVEHPADEKAITQLLLQKAASEQEKRCVEKSFNVISSLVSPKDQKEVARFFKENINRLPEAMIKLANKLL